VIDDQELAARREARARHRRRMFRRRRAVALLALLGTLAAIVLVARALTTGPGTGARAGGPNAATPKPDEQASPAPVARSTRDPARVAVPILMYHVIRPAPPGAPFPALYVPRSEFAAQMRTLKSAGWTAVTMDQVWDAWKHDTALPAGRPFVLTFDNGYESQSNEAMPVLRRLGWVGVLNVQLTGLPPSQGGLTDEAVQRLLAAGWELDTQGFSHADLVRLGPADLRREVAGSRRVLQRRWHVPVHWFCYPSGHYDARVVAAVQAAGYRGSTTVIPGWGRRASDPFRLPRLRVVGGTSPETLQRQIAAARHEGEPPPSYGSPAS
jgi:peptidoglycan/xylan/chitin deacetylase (PgdA/CDA1 family)